MGYTTEFYGSISIDPPLQPEIVEYINRFSSTRRMGRDTNALISIYPNIAEHGFNGPNGPTYGVEGEYFCYRDEGALPRNNVGIVDYNTPPSTQPGLWCQWIIDSEGKSIQWDGGEKFYNSLEWMTYIINNFIAPFGCTCNGTINAQGEDHDDTWMLIVENNVVSQKYLNSNVAFEYLKGLEATIKEIDVIIKRIDYFAHTEELVKEATNGQLELLTDIRRRLSDVYERDKSILEK